jgi:hypothetical protein
MVGDTTAYILSGVEPTNNRAERTLRELVVQRKIIGTLRNEKGIFIYETLPTLLATWKQRGLDPQGGAVRGPNGSLAEDKEEREKPPTGDLIRTIS